MLNKKSKIISNLNFLKLFILSPLLISIPLLLNQSVIKAGLEFQWDQDSGYKRLKWFQTDSEKRSRNSIFFFLRPSDRKQGLLKINMKIPKNFNSTLKEDKISLCKVVIGGFDTRTKCLENIPADIELSDDKKSLDIYPFSPIAVNKSSYAIVFKVFNPKRSGLYQFHSFGELAGKNLVSNYLGSWTIVID